ATASGRATCAKGGRHDRAPDGYPAVPGRDRRRRGARPGPRVQGRGHGSRARRRQAGLCPLVRTVPCGRSGPGRNACASHPPWVRAAGRAGRSHRPYARSRCLLRAQRDRLDAPVPTDRDFRSRTRIPRTLFVGPVAPARRPRRIAGRGNAAPAGEPPMITRRDLVKWGAVAPAVAVTPGVTWARMPQGVDALVVDRRLGAAVPSFDARQVYQIDGDVTALWYDVLDTR